METKHTKGEWSIDPKDDYCIITNKLPDNGGDIICMAPLDWEGSMLRWEANAKLILEAGNVANETGKTPRQLASENQELLSALIVVKDLFKGHQDYLASKGQNVSTIMADKINRLIDIVVDKSNK